MGQNTYNEAAKFAKATFNRRTSETGNFQTFLYQVATDSNGSTTVLQPILISPRAGLNRMSVVLGIADGKIRQSFMRR